MSTLSSEFGRGGDVHSGRSTTRRLISVIRKLSEHSGDASAREEERRKLEDAFEIVDERLKKIVKAKQDGLNRTVDDFQAICSNVHSASLKVTKVRDNLAACKEQIKCKREELKRLHQESEEQSSVLDIFERIDTISNVSHLIYSLMEQERYSQAAELVQKASADFELLSQIPTVAEITISSDIKEKLYAQIVKEIEVVLYEKSMSLYKTSRMTKNSAGLKQVGIFAQLYPSLSSAPDQNSKSSPTESESFEPILSELISSLAALNKLKDASKALQSNFLRRIEEMFASCRLEVLNFYKHSLVENKKKIIFSEFFELIFVRLVKIVDRKNIFIQKMNIAILQADKGASKKVAMYSLSDFLETFQQAMINILYKFLVEVAKDSSINSSAGKFYQSAASSPLRSSSSSGEVHQRQYVSFTSYRNPGGLSGAPYVTAVHSNQPEMSEMITASIMNITLIDTSLDKICAYICEQLAFSKEQCSLYVSKQALINTNLFNHLSEKLKRILEDSFPKDGIGYILDSKAGLTKFNSEFALCESCIVVYEQLSYLADISRGMPSFITSLEALTTQFLGGFSSRIHQQYISILSPHHSEGNVSAVLKLLGAKNLKSHLRNLKSWRKTVVDFNIEVAKDSLELQNNNFVPVESVNKEIFATLAALGKIEKVKILARSETCSETFKLLSAVNQSITWLFGQDFDLITIRMADGNSSLAKIVEGLESIADTCLLACNLELKVITFHYISGLCTGKSSNGLSLVEVHKEVKELVRVLQESELVFTRYLCDDKFNFVVDGLTEFLEAVFLQNASNVFEIISSSVSFFDRLTLDVHELKRVFKSISYTQNVKLNHFDRILTYFDFIKFPPHDMVRAALEKDVWYTEKEWRGVLEASAKKFGQLSSEKNWRKELPQLMNQLSPVTKERSHSAELANGSVAF